MKGRGKGNRNKETPTTDIGELRKEFRRTQQDNEANNHRQNVAWAKLTYTSHRNGVPQHAGVIETDDDGSIFIIRDTHDPRSYMPKRNGWYPCVIPGSEQEPLFIAGRKISFIPKGEVVYISKVLPAETETRTVNGSDSVVIIRSLILMRDDLMKENPITLFFGKTDFCRIWIENPEKRGETLRQLLRRDGGSENNSWKIRNGMLVPPERSSLNENDIVNVVLENKT